MKTNFLYVIKILSVPLVLITAYLLMYVVWKLLGLPSDSALISLLQGIFERYGLWVVFISALVEGFMLLGQYFPGGTIIFLGVISAGKDIPRVVEVVGVVSIAFIISYSLNYLVGKYGWYRLFVKLGLGKSIEDSKKKIQRRGMSVVLLSYWEPNLASITATAAGIIKVPMKNFQLYSISGVIIWNIFWGALVFSLGGSALKMMGLKFVLTVFVVWTLILLIENFFTNILKKIVEVFYIPRFKKIEEEIGFKIGYKRISNIFIDGLVVCDMTNTWKKFGLKIEKGANYFTMGRVVDGVSTRFDPKAQEYQSWLGGYTVKLEGSQEWTPKDHFRFAIADQNSWLKNWYGDPTPVTTIEGWELIPIDNIKIGQYVGKLYQFGCTTDDDVGVGYKTKKLHIASMWMAALFNISNSNLKLKGNELRPKVSDNKYERLKLLGYIAIFDIKPMIKIVLYANGTENTFDNIKTELINSIKSCDIIEV